MKYWLLMIVCAISQTFNMAISASTLVTDILGKYENFFTVCEITCSYKDSFHFLKSMHNKQFVQIIKNRENNLDADRSKNKRIFVMDMECKKSAYVLMKANQLNLFSTPYKWILVHTTPFSSLARNFSKINIFVDSDVSMCRIHKNETVTVSKIFKYRLEEEMQIEDAGYWTKEGGYNNLQIETNAAKRRHNLTGVTLHACFVITHNESLNHLMDRRNRHIDSLTKVNFMLVQLLVSMVQANFNYSTQPTWGYRNNETGWDGMIGRLYRKEADIAGTPSFFILERVDVIDYISMTTSTRYGLVFREPKLSYVTNVFTLPFSRRVWISIIFLVIIFAVLLYFVMMWEYKQQRHSSKKLFFSHNQIKYNIVDIALISFGAVCQQATPSVPNGMPGKIITITLFVALMFLYSSYCSNILAILQSSSWSIQTLDDLRKSSFGIGLEDTVYTRYYFPLMTDPMRQEFYHEKVAPPGQPTPYMPIEEGVLRLREGLFAYHMEIGPCYTLIEEFFEESEKCGINEISFMNIIDPWLPVQKNSSFKKILKIGLRRIRETGLQAREVHIIYTKKPICTSRGNAFISVGIVDCYPAVAVLAAGMIAALFIWILEIISYNRYLRLRFVSSRK